MSSSLRWRVRKKKKISYQPLCRVSTGWGLWVAEFIFMPAELEEKLTLDLYFPTFVASILAGLNILYLLFFFSKDKVHSYHTLHHFTLLSLQGKLALQQPLKIQQKTCFKQPKRWDEACFSYYITQIKCTFPATSTSPSEQTCICIVQRKCYLLQIY